MAELLINNLYQDFTIEQLQTQEGITRLNDILRRVSDGVPSDGESVKIYQGYGSPESAVTAGIGSIYMRVDGGTDTSIYRKESGTGNTGWVAISSNPETVAWTDYSSSSTIVGWSSFTTKLIYYKVIGKTVFIYYDLRGTSNSTSLSFTLPYTAVASPDLYFTIGLTYDNSAYVVAAGKGYLAGGSSTVILYKVNEASSADWTASGTKIVTGSLWFQSS